MRRALFLTLFAVLVAQAVGGGENKKDDALARDVVQRLYKASDDRDVDAIMKLVDVPFCLDGREIIKDKVKLRKIMEKSVARQRAGMKFKIHIRKVAPMLDFIENKKVPPSRGADMSAVLAKNHRVVFVEIERSGPPGGFQPTWIGVNFENGKPTIVGYAD
jgi:hypothetical protein